MPQRWATTFDTLKNMRRTSACDENPSVAPFNALCTTWIAFFCTFSTSHGNCFFLPRSSSACDAPDGVQPGWTGNVQLRLDRPVAVARGDRVQIQSLAGRIRIATAGVALESGKVGEQIAVRNESSKRTIHPWILAPGTVGTRPPEFAAK